jgi:hypothetical protein
MFKAPKYSTLLDPKHIQEGYLRKLFDPCKVTERDFFLAVTEAHRRYQRFKEQWFRLLMKKPAGTPRSPAMKKLEDDIESAADGVTWLIGGLLGCYDEMNNASAIAMMQELLRASRKRARREQRKKVTGSEDLQVCFRKGRK